MPRRTLGKPTGSSYSAGISVTAGRLVFISGIVAMDENGDVIAPGDMEAQTRHIFGRIAELLAEAGADFRHVVKITTFVTDMSQYADFSKVRGEVFRDGYPASATVGVSALVFDGLVVEVEAIAVV
jgi:2-iminobutanoate/2-iminopropanoate deaminase